MKTGSRPSVGLAEEKGTVSLLKLTKRLYFLEKKTSGSNSLLGIFQTRRHIFLSTLYINHPTNFID